MKGGTGVKIAGGCGCALLVTALLPLLLLALLVAVLSETKRAAKGELDEGAVPPLYLSWVLKAGAMCDEIAPPLIAAQIEQESGWNPDAVSPVGAEGLSQFMPGTWTTWGRDDDGSGKADPFDPGDAIMAQGRYDCAHAKQMTTHLKAGRVKGELIDLVLASYNAGAGAVLQARGVPDFAETRTYIASINALTAKYTKTLAGGGAVPAGQRLKSPLRENALVTSPYGVNRPGSAYRFHTGIDFGTAVGTPVYAADAGTVTFAGWNSAYGNRIVVRHRQRDGKSVETTYNHLFSMAVAKGTTVGVGQAIGATGNTGNSTGPHLHFEVKHGGEFTDPAPWIGLD